MARQRLGINRKNLKEDKPVKAELAGKGIVIVLHNGKIYALDSECTHEGGPLDEGTIEGDEIVCPWHRGKYYIKTGKADEETKWVHDTRSYKLEEDGSGELFTNA
jgi:nitrite reductase/ring-hydroxylating ferredoxin subunit